MSEKPKRTREEALQAAAEIWVRAMAADMEEGAEASYPKIETDAEWEATLAAAIRESQKAKDATLISRLRAALRLLENEEITPTGRRIIEKILDEAEDK